MHLLRSGIQPWIRLCLMQMLPSSTAPTSPTTSGLSSSISESRISHPILLASATDKEFVISFLYHSWPLLGHKDEEISGKTRGCWRLIKRLNSGQDMIALATLDDLLRKADQHMKEVLVRQKQRASDTSESDTFSKEEQSADLDEWKEKVKPEQLEEILLGDSISDFVRRVDDGESHIKERWIKERQDARKKKTMR